jgi:PPP family 3-phenylpropionic acid transporter
VSQHSPTPSIVRPALVYMALFGAVGAYFPYIGVFFQSIGLSLEVVGLFGALNSGIALLAAPAWGAVADWVRDVRGPLVAAGLFSAGAAAILAVVRDPIAVALGVCLLAAGAAGLGPMLDSRTIDIVGENRDRFARARAWGSAAFIVVSLLVGLLIDRTTPAGMFLAYAPLLVVMSLAAWFLLGGGRRSRRTVGFNPAAGLAQIVQDPRLGPFFLGSVLVWATVAAITTFISIHMAGLGADGTLIGALWAAGALVEVPLMLLFPSVASRWGAERLIVVGALAFAARGAAFALAGQPAVLVAVAPLGGVGFAFFYVGTVTYVARTAPREIAATAQGIFSGTAFSLGSILGAVIAGQLAGVLTLPALFATSALGTLVAAGVVRWSIGRRLTRGGPPDTRPHAPTAC